MNDSDRVRVRVSVDGVVQGVFFRASLQREALGHRLDGWVRNRPDGSVEAALEGPEPAVAAMVEWCRHGPPRAVVDSVDIVHEQPTGESGFRLRYDD